MRQYLRRIFACLTLCALLVGNVPAAAANYYADVPGDFWAAEDIRSCVRQGYFFLESGNFGVGKEMTRAEFAVVLCRFFGWKAVIPSRVIYEDVPTNVWYAGAIETAYRKGVITSQRADFRPGEPITRSEAAAMLIRALGYGTIAGLTQDMSLPFEDVDSNVGYIAMVYGLGLMDGTSANTFSPDGTVTREQMAVILMRMYDKLNDTEMGRAGIATSAKDLANLSGYDAVAVPASYLVYNGSPQLASSMDDEEVEAIRAAAKAAGAKLLLHVEGGPYQLRENGEELAAVLLQGVRDGNYDGLYLNIAGLTSNTQRKELTATAELLRKELDRKLLYIEVEAPAWKGKISGYDYAALGEVADRLVLRVNYAAGTAGDIPTAPQEPLEEVYYVFNRLRGLVDVSKLSLLTSATGAVWNNGTNEGAMKGTEIAALLEEGGVESHYSSRYASAYLETEQSVLVWYLNGQSIEERVRLARFFGVGHLCLSELSGVLPDVLEAMP